MLGFGLAIEPQLWALMFVMVRVGAAFIAAPVFGNMSVPLPVRVALSGGVAVLVLGTILAVSRLATGFLSNISVLIGIVVVSVVQHVRHARADRREAAAAA